MAYYVVSACLAGHACRYNATAKPCHEVTRLVKNGKAIPVCPELLAGLGVPRVSCEQKLGHVYTEDGRDVTEEFNNGAEKALAEAIDAGCTAAVLKERSPSCGVTQIYDGTFSKRIISGQGIWAAKLNAAGFLLFTEEHLPPDAALQE